MEDVKHLNIYEENTGSLKKAIVKKGVADMSWMKHIFVPLENLQEVYLHPDQKDVTSHYLKIIHSENKCISVFNKAYFDIVDQNSNSLLMPLKRFDKDSFNLVIDISNSFPNAAGASLYDS